MSKETNQNVIDEELNSNLRKILDTYCKIIGTFLSHFTDNDLDKDISKIWFQFIQRHHIILKSVYFLLEQYKSDKTLKLSIFISLRTALSDVRTISFLLSATDTEDFKKKLDGINIFSIKKIIRGLEKDLTIEGVVGEDYEKEINNTIENFGKDLFDISLMNKDDLDEVNGINTSVITKANKLKNPFIEFNIKNKLIEDMYLLASNIDHYTLFSSRFLGSTEIDPDYVKEQYDQMSIIFEIIVSSTVLMLRRINELESKNTEVITTFEKAINRLIN